MINNEQLYTNLYKTILNEHLEVFEKQNFQEVQQLIVNIEKSQRIFVMGVGREGITARAFAMRLMHLGKEVHWIWDDTTPGMQENDLFIVVNGSGNISHINCVIENALSTKATIFGITGSPSNHISKLTKNILFVPASVYKGTDEVVQSIQPMGNLFEQHLFLLFDIIIMILEKSMNISHEQMSSRHRNIE